MRDFAYRKLKMEKEALHGFTGPHGNLPFEAVRFLAGGTTLVDLMKLDVEIPHLVADVNGLPLAKIEPGEGGGVRIGATVRNSDLANHPVIRERYPVLSQALLSGASAQLRNKATTAGNLLQRTRCVYFRDPAKPCNKRSPGSGCPAIEGFHRNLAILGTSDQCIATNPSDMNVALRALEARVHVVSAKGSREIDIADFHLLPGATPERETSLAPGELITAVSLPPLPPGTRSLYLKLRDRASYEFALASAAVALTLQGGRLQRARFAMGGIGTKPWRVPEAEKRLEGGAPIPAVVEAFLAGAKPLRENGFKVALAKRCLAHALEQAMKA